MQTLLLKSNASQQLGSANLVVKPLGYFRHSDLQNVISNWGYCHIRKVDGTLIEDANIDGWHLGDGYSDKSGIRKLMRKDEVPYDFEDIRTSLNGMLQAEIYEEYYRIARNESRASILELGTGQGASTVAFALGVKDSGRSARVIAIDQFSQNVRGPHPASRRTHGDKAVALNLRAFEKGLQRYHVHDCVDIHIGRTEDIDINLESYGEVDVMAIDVDGMLDRDLGLFYDHVSRGGLLILDDYASTINAHGRKALGHYRELDREEAVTAIDGLSPFHRRRLLGKHLLIYKLVERFEALGLLSKEQLIGVTLFCRKLGDASFSDRWTSAEGDAIEQSIVDDLLTLLTETGDDRKSIIRPFVQRLRRLLVPSASRR